MTVLRILYRNFSDYHPHISLLDFSILHISFAIPKFIHKVINILFYPDKHPCNLPDKK